MIQLILNGITLPESRKGGYTAYRDELSVSAEMINGRLVKELRGEVWIVSYQYGWFSDPEKTAVLAACELGRKQPIECSFLPPHSNELITSTFWVTSIQYPRFYWSSNGDALWADFAVELREVQPSD